MPKRKQILVTAVALITGSFFINLVWILNRHNHLGETGMPLPVVFICLFVIAAGVAAILCKSKKIANTPRGLSCCNCIASVNFAISITSAVFLYFYNGGKVMLNLVPVLIPLFIAVLNFEKIFLRVKRENDISVTGKETADLVGADTLNNESNISI